MLVRYFDLGAHDGGEVARIRKLLKQEPLATGRQMYAFEAHPRLARRCRWRFWRDPSVRVVRCALGSHEGECELFLNRNLVGSSIYAGKQNVIPGRKVVVPCTRFSTWLGENMPADWRDSFNIIKSNIEGAEWDVWHDMVENDLVSAFDLWLGAKEGHDGWSDDLYKIDGMRERAKALTAGLRDAGVTVYRFTCWDKKIPNSDIPAQLHESLLKAAECV